MEFAKNFTQSLRKTIKITCYLKTCVFPQNFPPDSQKAFLTNVPEKIHRNCEPFGLKVQKKIGNYLQNRKKINPKDLWRRRSQFLGNAEKISEIVFTQSPKTLRKISL